MKKLKLCIAAVLAGMELKDALKKHLVARDDLELTDIGLHSKDEYVSYVEVASKAAERIQSGEFDKAILICGTGMGMALVANKYKGIHASVCESVYSAAMAKIVSDTNVMALGQFILGSKMACEMVDAWLDRKLFDGFPSEWAVELEKGIDDLRGIEQINFK